MLGPQAFAGWKYDHLVRSVISWLGAYQCPQGQCVWVDLGTNYNSQGYTVYWQCCHCGAKRLDTRL